MLSSLSKPNILLSNIKNIRNIKRNLSNYNAKNQKVQQEEINKNNNKNVLTPAIRFLYREFLPDPDITKRNEIREKLERSDMLKRRSSIELPSFYVGSIISVKSSDRHDLNKQKKFVGICIQKRYTGLRHEFVLRNIIDNLGIEIAFDMYDPKIQNITVLRLEKRLDDDLLYLRDALPEYSTFSVDMEPEYTLEGAPVPINDIKVILKPRPWVGRWERKGYKGIANIDECITDKMKMQVKKGETPWEKYDLMKEYRRTIPEEEQNEIFSEVVAELQKISVDKQNIRKKRIYGKPQKYA